MYIVACCLLGELRRVVFCVSVSLLPNWGRNKEIIDIAAGQWI